MEELWGIASNANQIQTVAENLSTLAGVVATQGDRINSINTGLTDLAGHAVQTARGYAFGRFRTALVPVVNLTQRTWGILFVLGMIGLYIGKIYDQVKGRPYSVVRETLNIDE